MGRKSRRRPEVGAGPSVPGGDFERRLAAAAELHRQGRLAEAEAGYRRLLRLRPAAGEALRLLGAVLHQQERNEEALAVLDQAVAGERPAAQDHYYRGAALHALGRLDDAVASFRAALALDRRYADAHFALGNVYADRDEPQLAIECYRLATRHAPQDREAWLNLGNALSDTGAWAEAIACYRRAIRIAPGLADGHLNLAATLMEAGDLDGALASYREALALGPLAAESRYDLGRLHEARGEAAEAEQAYRQALELQPDLLAARLAMAALLASRGRGDEAEEHYRRADEQDFVAARLTRGLELERAGEPAAAESHYRRAAARAPEDPNAALNLGNALSKQKRFEAALAEFERAARLDPSLWPARLNIANMLQELARLDEAIAVLEALLAAHPGYAEAHYNYAVYLREKGDFAAAVAALERALEIRPDFAKALTSKVGLKSYAAGDQDIGRLERLLASQDIGERQRMEVAFALGKVYDDLGRCDDAFAQFADANRVKHERAGYDAAAEEALVERLIATFSGEFLAAREGYGAASERPVFVLGMPRSGTTLVEQILASHPQVHGGGELRTMRQICDAMAAEVGSAQPFPECARELDADSAAQLGRRYLDHIATLSETAARVIDKMPHNFQRVGAIALLLPGARLIHCRRDPLDTCLSCFFQDFAGDYPFANDLASLGHFYGQYRRLMEHWRAVSPLPLIEVDYEALVADLEGESRRLVAFCGLDWDSRCLAFHRTERQIRTVSQWQVRQPLYTASVGRWRRYERHLAPLLAALGRAAT